MAQVVSTVDQRTLQTTESGQRPPRPVFQPPADIYETRDSIVVLAEMPGVAPDLPKAETAKARKIELKSA
jgi:HSP20 family molecular chaperone IbpA